MADREKVAAWLGVAAGILALASTAQSFVAFDLSIKLLVIGVGAFFAMLAIPTLAKWSRPPRDRPPPYIGKETVHDRGRFALSLLAIVVASVVFGFIAWKATDWFTFRFLERSTDHGSEFVLIAPPENIDLVTVSLPSATEVECESDNVTDPNTRPQPSFSEIGPSSQSPKIKIDNFVSPQAIRLTCTPATGRPDIATEPRTEIYSQQDLMLLRSGIVIVGGITCAIAWLILWCLWRSDTA
jgi:hypothetical protein